MADLIAEPSSPDAPHGAPDTATPDAKHAINFGIIHALGHSLRHEHLTPRELRCVSCDGSTENIPLHTQPTGVNVDLATLPPNAHIDIKALAQILGRHFKSIERAVRRGELPPPIKFAGKRVWMVRAIIEHLLARQDAASKKAKRKEEKLRQ